LFIHELKSIHSL